MKLSKLLAEMDGVFAKCEETSPAAGTFMRQQFVNVVVLIAEKAKRLDIDLTREELRDVQRRAGIFPEVAEKILSKNWRQAMREDA